MSYCPNQGDLIWLNFNPQAGHEQAGRRPALVLSKYTYNQRSSLMLACPITSQVKGYPFEVALPRTLVITGVILADQVKSLDWKVRNAVFVDKLPVEVLQDVLAKLDTLFY